MTPKNPPAPALLAATALFAAALLSWASGQSILTIVCLVLACEALRHLARRLLYRLARRRHAHPRARHHQATPLAREASPPARRQGPDHQDADPKEPRFDEARLEQVRLFGYAHRRASLGDVQGFQTYAARIRDPGVVERLERILKEALARLQEEEARAEEARAEEARREEARAQWERAREERRRAEEDSWYDTPEWEARSGRTRAKRLAAARARQKLRDALSSLAAEGYYVFEDLLADAGEGAAGSSPAGGAIDQLALGPNAAHMITLHDHEGCVWRSHEPPGLVWGRDNYSPDAPEGEKQLWRGVAFEEDLDRLHGALAEDLSRRALGHPGPALYGLMCFTEAYVHHDAKETHPSVPVSVLDLRDAVLAPPPEGRPPLSAEEVDEFAQRIARAYERKPWLVPEGREARAADLFARDED